MGRLVRDYAFALIPLTLKALLPLVGFPIILVEMGIEQLGFYIATYALVTLIATIVDYSFGMTGMRDIAQSTSKRDELLVLSDIVFAKLTICLLVAAGVLLALPFLDLPLSVPDALALGSIQGLSMQWYFFAKKKSHFGAIFESCTFALSLAWIYLVCQISSDFRDIIRGQAALVLLCQIFAYRLAFAGLGTPKFSPMAPFKRIFADSGTFVARFMVTSYTTISVLIVGSIAGPSQAALFGIAERVVSVCALTIRPLSMILIPLFSTHEAGTPGSVVRRAFRIAIAFSLLCALIAALVHVLADTIIINIFGTQAVGAADVLRALIWTLTFSSFNLVVGSQLLIALSKERSFLVASLVAGLANLLLGLGISPTRGAAEMALMRIVIEAGLATTYAWVAWRHLRTSADADTH